jgi:hypothetical protein
LIAAEVFLGAKWDVEYCVPADRIEEGEGTLLAAVGQKTFDVLGLSVSRHVETDALAALLRSVRAASGPELGILVGGWFFDENPARVRAVGADAYAARIDEAPKVALDLVLSRKRD